MIVEYDSDQETIDPQSKVFKIKKNTPQKMDHTDDKGQPSQKE